MKKRRTVQGSLKNFNNIIGQDFQQQGWV